MSSKAGSEFQVCVFSHTVGDIVLHYDDVIMGAIASQITSLAIVYSTIYSGWNQIKHHSSASLAFVRGIPRWPVNAQMTSNAENVSIWWRHHDTTGAIQQNAESPYVFRRQGGCERSRLSVECSLWVCSRSAIQPGVWPFRALYTSSAILESTRRLRASQCSVTMVVWCAWIDASWGPSVQRSS